MKMSTGAAKQAIDFTKKSKEKKPRGMLDQMGGAAENIASQISSGNPQSPMQQPSIMNRVRQAANEASGMFGQNNRQPVNNAFSQLRNTLSAMPIKQSPQNQIGSQNLAQQIAGQDSRNAPKPMQQIGSALGVVAGNMNRQSEAQQQMQPATPEQQVAPAQDNSSIDQQIAALQAQIQQLQSQKK